MTKKSNVLENNMDVIKLITLIIKITITWVLYIIFQIYYKNKCGRHEQAKVYLEF